MKFVIVKGKNWPDGFSGPVTADESCHDTYTGSSLGVSAIYHDREDAEIDCDLLNKHNPCGCYFVSDVIEV